MSQGGEHQVVIRRRGRSHRAWCPCGWSGHAWNDLRPAEADAWEHVHGTDCIVDSALIPGPATEPLGPPVVLHLDELGDSPATVSEPPVTLTRPEPGVSSEALVRRARELAGSPSPYGRQGSAELWNLALQDRSAVEAAIKEIGELLAAHSRRSAGTADGQWLELITAKRLLEESVREARPSYSS